MTDAKPTPEQEREAATVLRYLVNEADAIKCKAPNSFIIAVLAMALATAKREGARAMQAAIRRDVGVFLKVIPQPRSDSKILDVIDDTRIPGEGADDD